METYEKVRLIMLEEFIKAQTKNGQYSMRAYAKKLGIGQSATSEILAGKRPITKKSATKILQGLDKDPFEISNILSQAIADETPAFEKIDLDTFRLISDWYYYAILSLAETKGFQSSPEWIAQRLGLSVSVATQAIVRLLHLELLKEDNKGQLKTTGRQLEVMSKVANSALRKANRQNLEMATEALENIPVEKRDFTAITLCMDPQRMEDARKMIRNFRRNFNRVMESGHKKEVYKLCVQFFPLTKTGATHEK